MYAQLVEKGRRGLLPDVMNPLRRPAGNPAVCVRGLLQRRPCQSPVRGLCGRVGWACPYTAPHAPGRHAAWGGKSTAARFACPAHAGEGMHAPAACRALSGRPLPDDEMAARNALRIAQLVLQFHVYGSGIGRHGRGSGMKNQRDDTGVRYFFTGEFRKYKKCSSGTALRR